WFHLNFNSRPFRQRRIGHNDAVRHDARDGAGHESYLPCFTLTPPILLRLPRSRGWPRRFRPDARRLLHTGQAPWKSIRRLQSLIDLLKDLRSAYYAASLEPIRFSERIWPE